MDSTLWAFLGIGVAVFVFWVATGTENNLYEDWCDECGMTYAFCGCEERDEEEYQQTSLNLVYLSGSNGPMTAASGPADPDFQGGTFTFDNDTGEVLRVERHERFEHERNNPVWDEALSDE